MLIIEIFAGCPDDSYTDGCALRELVRLLAKTMSEKGTFDAEAEQMINEFRCRILGYRNGPNQRRDNAAKENKVEKRRREFMKLRAISFNGGLGDEQGAQHLQQGQAAKTSSSSTSASSSASSGYSSAGEPAKDRKSRASNWIRQRAHSVSTNLGKTNFQIK